MARAAFILTLAFTNFWFLIYNFGSRYARKLIKGSKDSDDSLVYKKKHLSEKMPNYVGA